MINKLIIIISLIAVVTSLCGEYIRELECTSNGCDWLLQYGAEAPECLIPQVDECYCDDTKGLTPNPAGSYGDCNCDKSYGLLEMTLRYTNAQLDATLIEFYYDGLDTEVICWFDNVLYNQEVECNIQDYMDPVSNPPTSKYEKFRTNTDFKIIHTDGSECIGAYHTSCSSDIVGQIATEGCDTDLLCTAWMDAGPTNKCSNGLIPCDCRQAPPEPTLPQITECYCQNPAATGVNPNTGGLGWGECDCTGGMIELRWKYLGLDVVDIRVYDAQDNTGNVVCEFIDVVPQQEITCNIWDIKDANGVSVYQKFAKNTHFEVQHFTTGSPICSGVYHTSCSRDIVGFYATNDECTELICTGWKDANWDYVTNPFRDCDDGWDTCDCTTTSIPTTTTVATITTTVNPCPYDNVEACVMNGCDWINSQCIPQTPTNTQTTQTAVTDSGTTQSQTKNTNIQSTKSDTTIATHSVTQICMDEDDIKFKIDVALVSKYNICQFCFCNDGNKEICIDKVEDLTEKDKSKFMRLQPKGCGFEGECQFEYVGFVDGYANKLTQRVCDCSLFECKDTQQTGIVVTANPNNAYQYGVVLIVCIVSIFACI